MEPRMSITVRDARPRDATLIADFNSRLAAETEDTALDPAIIGPGVARILGDPRLGRYWVAEIEREIVGQIMVTYEWSDWRNGMLWWLQSVYVRQDHRRGGVFAALYRHVESLAREAPGVAGLRLYVDAGNRRAQDTYTRLGLRMTGYRVMQVEFGPSPQRGGAD